MFNIELARKIQRAKTNAALRCLHGAAGIHELVLSFISKNPITEQIYWVPPMPIQDGSGVFVVKVCQGDATLQHLDESGIHLLLPCEGGSVPTCLPYDYLFQIECFDPEGVPVFFDMLPVILDVEEDVFERAPEMEKKRSHLRLVQ